MLWGGVGSALILHIDHGVITAFFVLTRIMMLFDINRVLSNYGFGFNSK